MNDLNNPLQRPDSQCSDEERFEALSYAVTASVLTHTTRLVTLKFFSAALKVIAMALMYLTLIEHSTDLAWWACFMAFAVLFLDMVFNPAGRALWHCVRAAKLGEVASYMQDTDIPLSDAGLVKYWRQKAKNAGLESSKNWSEK